MDSVYAVGTCTQMCCDTEINRREREGRLHILEIIPSTLNTKNPKANSKYVIKEFTRSGVGQSSQDVKSLRTINALLQTIDYLLHEVITREYVPWNVIYDFIMDRLRAVRQDMVIQNFSRSECISILQPIIKFYVYSAYRLCEEPISIFDPVINKNHLLECLKRLLCLYDEFDMLILKLPHEAKLIKQKNPLYAQCRPIMESLYLILNLGNTTAMERALQIPDVWRTTLVKRCLEISLNHWQGNFVRVCREISKLPALLAAYAVLHLPSIRRKAFAVMSTAYNSRNLTFPAEKLQNMLLYNNINEVLNDCKYYNIFVADNNIAFTKSAFDSNKKEPMPMHILSVDKLLSKCSIPYLLLEDKTEYNDSLN